MASFAWESRWLSDAVRVSGVAESVDREFKRLGKELREHLPLHEAMQLKDKFKGQVKTSGGSANQADKYWSRLLFKYGFPGASSCDGEFWMLDPSDPEGLSVVVDKSRSHEVPRRGRRASAIPSAHRFREVEASEEPVGLLAAVPRAETEVLCEEIARLMSGDQRLRCCVMGPSGSGKTLLAVDCIETLMKDDALLAKSKLRVVIISGSDNEGDFLRLVNLTAVFWDWDDGNSLRTVVENQKKNPEMKLLLVLDDIAVVGAGDKALNEVFVNGRHFNCSVVLLSQQSNNLASTIVRNNSNVLIWGGLNGEQTDLVRKAIGLPTEVLSKREFGAWSFQNTGAPEHQFAVHFVSKKKEMPLILTKVAVDQPRLMLRGAVSNAGAGGGGGGGGGGASLAAVAEASFSQETEVMAPTPLPDPEILQLQMLVSEQQAKIIELEGEVREGDGYAHRLVKTQDELVHVKGLVKQLFGGPRAPDALLLQAAADFSDPDKERLRVILRELMVIATS